MREALALYRDILHQLEPKPLSDQTLPFYLKVGELARRTGDAGLAHSTLTKGADRFSKEGDARCVGELCLHILRAEPGHKDVYAQYARRMLDYGHAEPARQLLLEYAKRARSDNLGKVLGQMERWPEKDLHRLLTDFLDRVVPEERRRRRSSDHRRRPSAAIRDADRTQAPEDSGAVHEADEFEDDPAPTVDSMAEVVRGPTDESPRSDPESLPEPVPTDAAEPPGEPDAEVPDAPAAHENGHDVTVHEADPPNVSSAPSTPAPAIDQTAAAAEPLAPHEAATSSAVPPSEEEVTDLSPVHEPLTSAPVPEQLATVEDVAVPEPPAAPAAVDIATTADDALPDADEAVTVPGHWSPARVLVPVGLALAAGTLLLTMGRSDAPDNPIVVAEETTLAASTPPLPRNPEPEPTATPAIAAVAEPPPDTPSDTAEVTATEDTIAAAEVAASQTRDSIPAPTAPIPQDDRPAELSVEETVAGAVVATQPIDTGPSVSPPADTAPADTAPAEPEPDALALMPEGIVLDEPTVVVRGIPILDVSGFDSPAGRGYRIRQLVNGSDTLALTVVPLDAGTASQVGAGRVRVRESGGASIGTTRYERYLITGRAALPAADIEVLLRQLVEITPN